ncbi:MAG: tetratricopeptide repeat protein [candidate division WOR-3 bacterium]|nr:tetratricopeptide repeat protein [candidate division WOR-3 bacterium]
MEKRQEEIKELLKNSINLELQGKYKEAINLLEKAVRLNPGDGNLYNRLGDLYLKLNRTKDAINAFQNGIRAFKTENYLRNALALCKKILRYDPSNTEINFTIAELLIDLDEKGDAAMYLFSYIERQMAAGNKKEVARAMELLKKLKLSDASVASKMAAIYDKTGEKKKEEAKPEGEVSNEEGIPESSIVELELQPVTAQEDFKDTVSLSSGAKLIDVDSLNRLERLTEEIERVAGELRRAMRMDEVVVAIDKSLTLFSQQQKEAINLLHKTLNTDLENLKKTIGELREGTRANVDELVKILNNLRNAVSGMNESQRAIVERISGSLNDIGGQIGSSINRMLEDLRGLTFCYERMSQNICNKVEENCQMSASLLKVSGETKIGIQTINESLLKYFLNQDAQIKKMNKFILIMSIILGSIAILLLLILLLK